MGAFLRLLQTRTNAGFVAGWPKTAKTNATSVSSANRKKSETIRTRKYRWTPQQVAKSETSGRRPLSRMHVRTINSNWEISWMDTAGGCISRSSTFPIGKPRGEPRTVVISGGQQQRAMNRCLGSNSRRSSCSANGFGEDKLCCG